MNVKVHGEAYLGLHMCNCMKSGHWLHHVTGQFCRDKIRMPFERAVLTPLATGLPCGNGVLMLTCVSKAGFWHGKLSPLRLVLHNHDQPEDITALLVTPAMHCVLRYCLWSALALSASAGSPLSTHPTVMHVLMHATGLAAAFDGKPPNDSPHTDQVG